MSDTFCSFCAEPWEYDYVRHELWREVGLPDARLTDTARTVIQSQTGFEFGTSYGHVTRCPACKDQPEPSTHPLRAEVYAALSDVLGDDDDGLLAEIEDLEYINFFD